MPSKPPSEREALQPPGGNGLLKCVLRSVIYPGVNSAEGNSILNTSVNNAVENQSVNSGVKNSGI